MPAEVDFCGEVFTVDHDNPLTIGREGRLVIDDNPYLHRRFLEITEQDSVIWLTNRGAYLSATVSDYAGLMQAWLAPGASIPLVFRHSVVWFTAGPTTYEFEVTTEGPQFQPAQPDAGEDGATTVGRMTFTADQSLLILVLAEDVLRRGNRGAGTIPSSADASARLGWTLTKFNRKLDNVCDKLTRSGVRGLHGSQSKLATSRRARLVEYALAARLIHIADLERLDQHLQAVGAANE
jgi:hypothetical protein